MTEEKFIARNHALKEFEPNTNNNLISKIRHFIGIKFDIWDMWDIFPYRWNMWYYDKVRPILKPQHSKLRKAIPKQWADISSLIVSVNFQFIKSFYEDEYLNGVVDWSDTEHHQEFAKWLEYTYEYITKQRPELEKERDDSYPKSDDNLLDRFVKITDDQGRILYQMKDDGIPYSEKYSEVIRLEKMIEDKDTEILIQLIKRRDYFWT